MMEILDTITLSNADSLIIVYILLFFFRTMGEAPRSEEPYVRGCGVWIGNFQLTFILTASRPEVEKASMVLGKYFPQDNLLEDSRMYLESNENDQQAGQKFALHFAQMCKGQGIEIPIT